MQPPPEREVRRRLDPCRGAFSFDVLIARRAVRSSPHEEHLALGRDRDPAQGRLVRCESVVELEGTVGPEDLFDRTRDQARIRTEFLLALLVSRKGLNRGGEEAGRRLGPSGDEHDEHVAHLSCGDSAVLDLVGEDRQHPPSIRRALGQCGFETLVDEDGEFEARGRRPFHALEIGDPVKEGSRAVGIAQHCGDVCVREPDDLADRPRRNSIAERGDGVSVA